MNGSAPRSEPAPARRSARGQGGRPWLLVGVRYVLPAVVIVAGIVVMSLGGETDLEGGGGIVSAGLAIILINWLFRAGIAGEREREREDAAREYFARHGRWPDERR